MQIRVPNFRKSLGAWALILAVLVAPLVALAQPYSDLKQRSAMLSNEQRVQAQTMFSNALQLWKAGDFAAAEFGFRQGLDIDPANGPANFYYGDILQRKGQRDQAADYMARAAALAPTSAEAMKAQVALAGSLKKPGESFQDCPDVCPEMVVISPGRFIMGSQLRDETPHQVTIAYTFAVGKFDVTFSEWDACVADGGCVDRPELWGRGRLPVTFVDFDMAHAYAAWLSRKTGKPYRLLSEAEWEYAARAGTRTAFYWGDDVGVGNANCRSCGSRWDNKQAAPVGSFPPNAFGLYDMAGNVSQWTEDCEQLVKNAEGSVLQTYNGAPTDGSARQSCSIYDARYGISIIVRGGASNAAPLLMRTASRDSAPARSTDGMLGFRVARSLQ